MKRKFELAITLSIDVPVYFLDEPTTRLDLSAIQAVVLSSANTGQRAGRPSPLTHTGGVAGGTPASDHHWEHRHR
ncbi:hypothetical protein [Halocatena pleomorpha]|uniref:Uncharacterized protein n=1 Tax=Halocatena pleomorpha TaxID=1785090 RepID=A0A3P3R867_9EURY|nr:hypothetical protein [Halocatena pleomorpha]RRJ29672.1 hypothetical protein EIK79_11980 [Halocatena pleomorpha]